MSDEAEKVLAAARDGNIQLLRSLKRSVPLATDTFGATALHHATRFGKLDCLKWMVQKLGMKAKAKAKNGATPLHDACTQGKLLCVKFFIQDCELSPDITDCSGHTPLHLAARFGYLDIVKWLINKARCNAQLKSLNWMTAVHFAASGGHLNCLELLVSNGSLTVINERATDGTSPIYLAAQNGHFTCLKYLHTIGAKCDIKSRDGMHLIHAAAQNGHLDCIGYLVVQGIATATQTDSTGAIPAHYAAGEGHVPVLKWLGKRSELNIKDNLGGTPLHDGSEKGQLEAIQFLVEVAFLDPKLKDKSHMNPIDLAEKFGHKLCHQYLKDATNKILKIKAEKMSQYTRTFDKQTVEASAGSSFLHVLKKKRTTSNRPPSPKSIQGPSLPPLECTPDNTPQSTPRTSPVPPMILYGKTNEWDHSLIDVVSESDEDPDAPHAYEGHKNMRAHVLDTSGMMRYSPLEVVRDADENDVMDVDAYTHNTEDALTFDVKPQESLTEDMLNQAKGRTQHLNTRVQNGYLSPSPVHDFDHRSNEIVVRDLQAFATKIQAARARRSPSVAKVEFPSDENKENEIGFESPISLFSPPVLFPPSATESTANSDVSAAETEDKKPMSPVESPVRPSVITPQGAHEKPHESPEPPKSLSPFYSPLPSPTFAPLLSSAPSPPKPEDISDTKSPSPEPRVSPTQNPDPEDPAKNPAETTSPSSLIDEENYELISDDETVVKRNSIRREQNVAEEKFIPLRKRQLIPLPHLSGTSADKIVLSQDSLSDETWKNLPEWKRQVFKNRIMKEQEVELESRKKEEEESNKWAGVPAWKIPIMQRKENDRLKEKERLSDLPEWRKELAKNQEKKPDS